MSDYSSIQKKIMMDRARAAVLSRDYQLAARLYKGLLQNDPENIAILSALGDLYERSGKDMDSLPFYRSIVNLDPSNVNALNALGGIYRRLNCFDESIDALQKALIADENNIQIFYNLGSTYKIMGRYDNAIYCFTKVIESKPDDVLAYNHLGKIYSRQKRYDRAIYTYTQGLKIDPNHPVLHYNLAKCYEKTGAVQKSEQEFENALRYKPGWNAAVSRYADMLIRNNRTRDAKNLIGKNLQVNPLNFPLHIKMGQIHAYQNNYKDAEREYRYVLERDPKNYDALSGLATVFEETGRMLESYHVMKMLEENYPEDSKATEQYAHVLLTGDKVNSASKKIKKVWDEKQRDEDLLNLLGQFYIVKGDEGKALGCYKRIDELNPFYKDYLKDGATRFDQKGMFRKALDYDREYLKTNPEDNKAVFNMARTYENLDLKDEAADLYKELLSRDEDNAFLKSKLKNLLGIEDENTEEAASGLSEESEVAVDENIGDFALDASDLPDDEIDDSPEEKQLDPHEKALAESGQNENFDFNKLTQDDTDARNVLKNLDDEMKAEESLEDDEFGVDLDDLVDKELDGDFVSAYSGGKDNGAASEEDKDDDPAEEMSFASEDINDDMGLDKGKSMEVSDGLSTGKPEPEDEEFEYEYEAPVLDEPVASSGFSAEDPTDFGMPRDDKTVSYPADSRYAEEKYDDAQAYGGSDPSYSAPDSKTSYRQPAEPFYDSQPAYSNEVESGSGIGSGENSGYGSETYEPEPEYEFVTEELEGDELALSEEEKNLSDFENSRALGTGNSGTLSQGEEQALSDEEENLADFEGSAAEATVTGDEQAILDEEENLSDFENSRALGTGNSGTLSQGEEQTLSDEEENLADFEGSAAEATVTGDEQAISDEEENLADFEGSAAKATATGDEQALSDEEENLSDFEGSAAEPSVTENEGTLLEEEVPTVSDLLDGFVPDADAGDSLFEKAAETLGDIVTAINDKEVAEKFSQTAQLFLELKNLSNYLPEDKKEAFLESDAHMQLEYIINRLTGHPGLLATAESIRRKLGIADCQQEVMESGNELIKAVFTYMRTLLNELPDLYIARTMDRHIDHALSTLNGE